MIKRCVSCIQDKDESEFSFRSNKNPAKGRKSRCKLCLNLQHKVYQKKERYIENKKAKILVKNEKIVQYLLSHPCVDCGETDIRTLDFDHLLDKKFNVSTHLHNNMSWEIVASEMVKCEVRCSNCHRKVTHERANTKKQKMYLKYQSVLDKVNDTAVK